MPFIILDEKTKGITLSKEEKTNAKSEKVGEAP
jgi:hypothetical protein